MNVFVLYYIIFDIIDNNNQDNSVDNDEIVRFIYMCMAFIFFSAAIHLPLVRLCVPLWVNIAGRSAAYTFRISIIN